MYVYCFGQEVSPYGGPVHVGEAVIHISVHEGGFSHPGKHTHTHTPGKGITQSNTSYFK